MSWQIAQAEAFPFELGKAPKKIQNAYLRNVAEYLKKLPEESCPPKIKKLNGYKRLWRLRLSDEYRLVYKVDRKENLVTMLMLDHRAKIYERLGADEKGEPGVRIVAHAAGLMDEEPTPQAIGNAFMELAEFEPESGEARDRPLNQKLTEKLLRRWGVPEKYHAFLTAAHTEGELLGLSKEVPEPILERVLNGLWPPTIEELTQKPIRVAFSPEEQAAAADGERGLESFLLKLDGDQEKFVARFERDNPKGPWIVKGGPGAGKSTIALYSVRALLKSQNQKLPGFSGPRRILFTTYTKSLVNTSGELLKALGLSDNPEAIEVINVDKLASRFLPSHWNRRQPATSPKENELAAEAIKQCRTTDSNFAFRDSDARFLVEEVDWVILGQGLDKIDEYLDADRAGRGRKLGPQQKKHVWRFFEAFQKMLDERGLFLFSQRLKAAKNSVKPEYDYVFIDEAQDLTPVGIQFCVGLCRNPTNVFLTADKNQSIYGNGLSWNKVSETLKFTGRAVVLRKNYRTTKEVWEAIQQLAPNADDVDGETLDVEPVYSGPWPIYAECGSENKEGERLNQFFQEALRSERLSLGCGAVLCPTKKVMERVFDMLDKRLNPKQMGSSEVEIKHPGVKVMTMHSAKGLQFPVVAVAGVKEGTMPWPLLGRNTDHEHNRRQRRLLFVACSRAMRRLLVLGSCTRRSPFVQGLTDEHWEIENQ